MHEIFKVFLIFIYTFSCDISSVVLGAKLCVPLPRKPPEVLLTCREPGTRIEVPCDYGVPYNPGTVVKFRCKSHYTSASSSFYSRNQITCSQGRWRRFSRFQEFHCNVACGIPSPKAFRHPLIVYGRNALREQHPWHANIYKLRDNGEFEYICGGSLISSPYSGPSKTVLTAAHCVHEEETTKLRVALGSISSDFEVNLQNPTTQVFKVTRYVTREDFEKKTYNNDVALLELEDYAELSDFVLPVCFPYDGGQEFGNRIQLFFSAGNVGNVAGFGINEQGNISQSLKSAELPMITPKECWEVLQVLTGFNQFCAGYGDAEEKRARVCQGDSGSAFVLRDEYTLQQKKPYYILGVVSFGRNKNDGSPCHNAAVFTRVHVFSSWVLDHVKRFNEDLEQYDYGDSAEFEIDSGSLEKIPGTNQMTFTNGVTDDNLRLPSIFVTEKNIPAQGSEFTQEKNYIINLTPSIVEPTTMRSTLNPQSKIGSNVSISVKWTIPSSTTPKLAETSIPITPKPSPLPLPTITENTERTSCGPVDLPDGMKVTCIYPKYHNTLPDDKCNVNRVPLGTKAIFTCLKYWESSDSSQKSGERMCQNGSWGRISPKGFKCTVQCGSDEGRLRDVLQGKFRCPAAVALYQQSKKTGKPEVFCHGTLIGKSRRAVLTAAQCTGRKNVIALMGHFKRVWELNDNDKVQKRMVIGEDVHPDYDEERAGISDIAVMWLDKPISVDYTVLPMCLPPYEDTSPIGTLLWGRKLNRIRTQKGNLVTTPTVSIKFCKDSSTHQLISATVQRFKPYCHFDRVGISTCDIGGGGCVVTRDSTRGNWVLEGIVSPLSVGKNVNYCLAEGTQAVYTRVTSHVKWINSILRKKEKD